MSNLASESSRRGNVHRGNAHLRSKMLAGEAALTLALAMICLAIPRIGRAGVNVWTSHGPEGGNIQVLAIDPLTPTTLYAGTGGNGVFKSVDGGASWNDSGLINTYVTSLAIDPVTPSTLYSGTNGGVFKSVDGGASWSAINNNTVIGSPLAIDPRTPTTVYAAGGRGVFKSMDGGTSWSAINSGLDNTGVISLAIDPATPTTVYAGTHGGFFKSVDGGHSWSASLLTAVSTVLIDPVTPTTVYALTFQNSSPQLLKSTDGGISWNATGLTYTYIYSLAIDPVTPTTLYAGTDRGIFKSVDGGASWSVMNSGLANTFVTAVALDPVTPTTLYAGTDGGGVFKNVYGGETWSAINSGLTSRGINALAIDPLTPTTLYAGTNDGVFKSVDGGASWSDINNGLTNGGVAALLIDSATPTTLYAVTSCCVVGVVKSTDGGGSWSAINTGLTDTYVYSLAIDPVTPTTLYAGTHRSGIFKSMDGGTSWNAIGLTNSGVYSLAIDPVTPTTVYAGTDGGVFKSVDGGVSWSASSLTITSTTTLLIDPTTPMTLYLGTDGGGVFKSVDGGTSWNAINTGLGNTGIETLAIPPGTPRTVYAATVGGLFKSIDAGSRWISCGLTARDVLALAVNPATPTTVYAGTAGGGVFKNVDGGADWRASNTGLTNTAVTAVAIDPATPTTIYAGMNYYGYGYGVFKSVDAGADWSANGLADDTSVMALAIDPASPTTLYAATHIGGVFKSVDGGASWSAKGLLNAAALAIDPATPTTLYTAAGYVFKSTNGGGSWSAVNTGLTDVLALAIDPVNPATLYAAPYASGVFKTVDGGASWSAINNGLINYVHSLAVDPVTPTTLYAGTDYGVFRSVDGGVSWSATTLTNGYVSSLAVDPVTPTTLYAGTDGGVFKTVDGGGSWSAINRGLISTYVNALAIDPRSPTTVYAGTEAGVFVIQEVNLSLTVDRPIIDAGDSVTFTCDLGPIGAGGAVAFFITQGLSTIDSQQLTANSSGTATWTRTGVPGSWVPSVTVQCRADSVPGQPTSASVPLTVDCANSECPNGTSCTTPGQCQSGFCVDGVCCGNSSCPTGQACNVSGEEGQCQSPPCNHDGIKDPGEACDGDLGGQTCANVSGFNCGILNCTTDCSLDTSECGQNECSTQGVQCSADGTQVETCAPRPNGCLGLTELFCPNGCVNGACLSRHPVIIIPGIMGSELNRADNGNRVWLDLVSLAEEPFDSFLLPLLLQQDGATPDANTRCAGSKQICATDLDCVPVPINGACVSGGTDITSGNPLEILVPVLNQPIYKAYGDLLQFLQNTGGYTPGTDLFSFGYDWRVDLAVEADRLRERLQARFPHPTDRVDIIAHSMGGLLIRAYLERYPDDQRIAQVIYLGTPHLGAALAYAQLTGAASLVRRFDGAFPLLNLDTETFMAQNFPGVYELLPRLHFVLVNLGSGNIFEPLDASFAHLSNPSLVAEANSLHNDGLAGASRVARSFGINGTGKRTLAGFDYTDPSCPKGLSDLTGDGTVPSVSSQAFLDSSAYVFVQEQHKDLPGNTQVQQQILNILDGHEDVLAPGILPSVTSDTDGWQWYSCSPIRVQIADEQGNLNGLDGDGNLLEEIDDSSQFRFTENEGGFLPFEKVYQLAVNATNNGVFTLGFNHLIAPDGTIAGSIAFVDVPISIHTRASMTLSPTDQAPLLSLDVDGDGATDFTIGPNVAPPPMAFVAAMTDAIRSFGLATRLELRLERKIEKVGLVLQRGKPAAAVRKLEHLLKFTNAKRGKGLTEQQAEALAEMISAALRAIGGA